MARLLGEEVQVVDEQGVALAEVLAEGAQLAQPHGLDEAVGEVLAGEIADAPVGVGTAQAGVDALEQVRLAGANGAVQHQRVGRLAGRLDDAQGRGVGDAVARPDHELRQPPPAPRALAGRRPDASFGVGRREPAEALVAALRWPLAAKRRSAAPVSACGFDLRLFAAGGLEQLRVDDEAHRQRPAEHLAGRRRQGVAERLVQPLLEVPVGHADRQHGRRPRKTACGGRTRAGSAARRCGG